MRWTLPLFLSLCTATAHAATTPAYTTHKLDTGLEIIGLESHKVPLVTIVLAVKAGAMTETPTTNGLTHLWEHMFFKGNKRIPNQEAFNKRIRELGIVYNGDTSAEKVRYYFTLPSAFLDEGLQFMADAIATPLLEQVELEKERRVVLDEYDRSAAQPGFDFHNLERTLLYGDKGYLRDPLGHRPTIENATREQLYKIKDEVMVPSNSTLLVAGDFDPKKLKAMVEEHFEDWEDPDGWKPLTPPAFPPFPPTTSYVMTRPNVQNATVQITFAGPKARSQPAESFAADVLCHLLDHRSGKFYKKFIDSGLTFKAGLSYYTQSQTGEMTLYAETVPAKVMEVQKLLLAEVKEWSKPGYFTQTQLEDVRRQLTINHKREMNEPSEYVKSLAFWWAVTGLDYYGTYIENLQKTGFAETTAFAKQWLDGKPYLAAALLSPEDAKKVGLKDTAAPLVEKHLKAYLPASPKG
jgi:zinc protease